MVTVVQLVRASDCGSECRGFESHQSPQQKLCKSLIYGVFSFYTLFLFWWKIGETPPKFIRFLFSVY